MVLNPYFLNGSTAEQDLLQNLIDEQLKMYGVDVYYMPRKYVSKTTVIKEVIESKFDVFILILAQWILFLGYCILDLLNCIIISA